MKRKQWVVALAMLLALASMGVASDYWFGPSGGYKGAWFEDVIPEGARIVEVRVWAGKRVDAIQIVYVTANNERKEMDKRGGSGGSLQTLTLTGPDEYINMVHGKYGATVDKLVIRVEGKKSDSADFSAGGDGGSTVYKYEAPPGTEVVGFMGRAGKELDAIGVVLRARPQPLSRVRP